MGNRIVTRAGRYPDTVEARTDSSQRAMLLGSTGAWHQRLGVSKRLAVSQPRASQSVKRGEKIVKEKELKMMG